MSKLLDDLIGAIIQETDILSYSAKKSIGIYCFCGFDIFIVTLSILNKLFENSCDTIGASNSSTDIYFVYSEQHHLTALENLISLYGINVEIITIRKYIKKQQDKQEQQTLNDNDSFDDLINISDDSIKNSIFDTNVLDSNRNNVFLNEKIDSLSIQENTGNSNMRIKIIAVPIQSFILYLFNNSIEIKNNQNTLIIMLKAEQVVDIPAYELFLLIINRYKVNIIYLFNYINFDTTIDSAYKINSISSVEIHYYILSKYSEKISNIFDFITSNYIELIISNADLVNYESAILSLIDIAKHSTSRSKNNYIVQSQLNKLKHCFRNYDYFTFFVYVHAEIEFNKQWTKLKNMNLVYKLAKSQLENLNKIAIKLLGLIESLMEKNILLLQTEHINLSSIYQYISKNSKDQAVLQKLDILMNKSQNIMSIVIEDNSEIKILSDYIKFCHNIVIINPSVNIIRTIQFCILNNLNISYSDSLDALNVNSSTKYKIYCISTQDHTLNQDFKAEKNTIKNLANVTKKSSQARLPMLNFIDNDLANAHALDSVLDKLEFIKKNSIFGLSDYVKRHCKYMSASSVIKCLDSINFNLNVSWPEQLMNLYKIIIDSRELKSSLAINLFKENFKIAFRTLFIGDYILTKRIAIERKSIHDLEMSITSYRLIRQLKNLSEAYEIPILLIENINTVKTLNYDILTRYKLTYNRIRYLYSSTSIHTIYLFRLLLQSTNFESRSYNFEMFLENNILTTDKASINALMLFSANAIQDMTKYKSLYDIARDKYYVSNILDYEFDIKIKI